MLNFHYVNEIEFISHFCKCLDKTVTQCFASNLVCLNIVSPKHPKAMALDGNHFSEGACYQQKQAKDMAILSLVRQAHKLCASASSIQYLGEIRDAIEPTWNDEKVHSLFERLNPAFLDALFIATAAENLLKSELLTRDYVVHVVDKNIAPHLRSLQDKRPLPLSDIKTEEGRTGDIMVHLP